MNTHKKNLHDPLDDYIDPQDFYISRCIKNWITQQPLPPRSVKIRLLREASLFSMERSNPTSLWFPLFRNVIRALGDIIFFLTDEPLSIEKSISEMSGAYLLFTQQDTLHYLSGKIGILSVIG